MRSDLRRRLMVLQGFHKEQEISCVSEGGGFESQSKMSCCQHFCFLSRSHSSRDLTMIVPTYYHKNKGHRMSAAGVLAPKQLTSASGFCGYKFGGKSQQLGARIVWGRLHPHVWLVPGTSALSRRTDTGLPMWPRLLHGMVASEW